ncbi:MAG: PAS domain S-box protein [Deltaproteobacteria bacterium]|nr:PAS domain S-box protein [Deltaproteobacteria bacterium]
MKERITNIGLVGGGPYCVEYLDKYALGTSRIGYHSTRIVAVADKDDQSPGIIHAKSLNIPTVRDYHELYNPRYKIDLIIMLTREKSVLEEISKTHPNDIQILPFEIFEFLWKNIYVVEKELDNRTREMATVLNNIPDIIVAITPELDIVEVNHSFLAYVGRTRDEVIGRKCYEILEKKSQFCEICQRTCPSNEFLRKKQSNPRTDRIQIGKDGKRRYLDGIVHPVIDKEGEISRYIKISRDVTRLKTEQKKETLHLEKLVEERTKELQDTYTILLHQDKMSSLGKLSAAVVHEINNPIAGILNLILLMKRINEEESPSKSTIEQFNHYLSLMETETKRISRIVSNLLAFSRQSKEEVNHLDFNELIEKTLIINSNLIRINNIEIKKKLPAELPLLLGTEDQLQQVLFNLMSNAIESMESTEQKQLTIETHYSLSENQIHVSFTDTGIGIPKKNLLKLYEPFFTTKKKGKGVGLGLSLVYGIIERHHGQIKVKSKLNKYTTFKICLPLYDVTDEMQNREK